VGNAVPKFNPRHFIKKGRKHQVPFTWEFIPSNWAKEEKMFKMNRERQIMCVLAKGPNSSLFLVG
jgi:hypothetical protein